MKQLFICLTFWLCAITAYGQTFSPEEQKQLDSLNAIINNKVSHDTSLAGAYVGLSDILGVSNLDTMIPLCTKAKSIAEKALAAQPPTLVALALRKALSGALNNIGFIHDNQGDIPLALEYYHKSLKINEEISDKQGMAYSFINIGVIHNNQGDIPLALEYYHKSLKITEEIGDKQGMAYSFINIGYIHNHQGDISLALEYYHKSLKIQEEIGDKQGMAYSFNNIGLIHKKQGDPSVTSSKEDAFRAGIPLALEYFHKSLKIMEEIGDKQGMAISLANIGGLHLEQGALARAREMGERGLQIARDLGFPEEIMRNAGLLSKIAIKEGNYQQALEMRNVEIEMRDSINNKEAKEAAAKQQIKYEYEKQKAIDDAQYEKRIAIEQKEKEKQLLITYAAGVTALLLVAFLFFVFNRLKVTRKQKQIIENTHQQLAKHHKEIQDSINYAKRIQEAIMPSMGVMQLALKDSFVLYKPKDVVAGDFFWMEQHTDKVYFAAADCTGHGVPGAMVSVVCSNSLSKALLEENITQTGKLLDRTREIVIERLAKSGEDVKDGMDISLCMLDFNSMTLQWSGANNPLWLVRKNMEGVAELVEAKPDKQPIGIHENATPFTTHNFELQKGDTVYIFTDGYQDQFGGEKQKKFMGKQLKKLLLGLLHEKMDNQKSILDKEFENWRGQHEQVDDVCVIGVRI